MEREVKICKNCDSSFEIKSEDFSFYERMKVPIPTWCKDCRAERRFSFINVFNLYKRNCAKCGESTLSVFSEDKTLIIYCNHCWWGDSWDGLQYGASYDPSRNFFLQLHELFLSTPWQALDNAHSTNKNSKYVNSAAYQKDCYMNFWADFCENVFYSGYENHLKDSVDCFRMKDSELCYESIGCYKCYRTFFSEECDACTDVWFSRACFGLMNCFGCINLRNKSYCIWNKQYSREEYFEKLKEFNLDSRESIENIKKEALSFWLKFPNRFYIGTSMNVNVSGDYIYESKNAEHCYLVGNVKDSKFVQFISVPSVVNCYDYTGWGNEVELIYESSVVGEGASNIKFCHQCWPNVLDIEYSIYASGCRNVFGCINLRNKQYCILNKQYTKEEYFTLKNKIIEDMKKNPYIDKKGRVFSYGEFFPKIFTSFCYNETIAYNFFPKSKQEILDKDLGWKENKVFKNENIDLTKKVPDNLNETNDLILENIFYCNMCSRAYRFILDEINLMRKLNIPLPKKCFSCRESYRFSRINLPKIYERTCDKCGLNIKTTYSKERPEIIYCGKCYQAEFI